MEIATSEMQKMIETAIAKALQNERQARKSHAGSTASKVDYVGTISHFVPTKAGNGYNAFLRIRGHKSVSVFIPAKHNEKIVAGKDINGRLYTKEGNDKPTSVKWNFGSLVKFTKIPERQEAQGEALVSKQIVQELKV
jgi:hypothetical protein